MNGVSAGRLEVVQLLLERGANTHATNMVSRDAVCLNYACSPNYSPKESDEKPIKKFIK
jgi:hypothetical protein